MKRDQNAPVPAVGQSLRPDEPVASVARHAALVALYADIREKLSREVPIEIRTVRLASPGEIADWKWGQETLTREAAWLAGQSAK